MAGAPAVCRPALRACVTAWTFLIHAVDGIAHVLNYDNPPDIRRDTALHEWVHELAALHIINAIICRCRRTGRFLQATFRIRTVKQCNHALQHFTVHKGVPCTESRQCFRYNRNSL